MDTLSRFRGALLGMAVGDSLGIPTQFMDEKDIPDEFGKKVTDYYDNFLFEAGEYSDDTAMALCIAESFIENKRVVLDDIAKRFVRWEDTDGRDEGELTAYALRQFRDGCDASDAGRIAWEKMGRTSAGNGGLMRTAPVSLMFYNDPAGMDAASADICRITHYDPRCVLSCRAHNILLWALLRGNTREEAWELLCDSLGDNAGDEEFADVITVGRETPVSRFALDGHGKGYTYLSLKVAVSALMNYDDFETPIVEIINKGGDADTNACIAGSLLGALYGEEGIPERWRDGLLACSRIRRIATEIYDIVGADK
ncbi:MAG: ADP-ribosylglycohydrolase family protein [Abditibacteriota bacterium]|nr:ADP-ribosylglycohydrolase family protein [Abditibacteriota bacterium]